MNPFLSKEEVIQFNLTFFYVCTRITFVKNQFCFYGMFHLKIKKC